MQSVFSQKNVFFLNRSEFHQNLIGTILRVLVRNKPKSTIRHRKSRKRSMSKSPVCKKNWQVAAKKIPCCDQMSSLGIGLVQKSCLPYSVEANVSHVFSLARPFIPCYHQTGLVLKSCLPYLIEGSLNHAFFLASPLLFYPYPDSVSIHRDCMCWYSVHTPSWLIHYLYCYYGR